MYSMKCWKAYYIDKIIRTFWQFHRTKLRKILWNVAPNNSFFFQIYGIYNRNWNFPYEVGEIFIYSTVKLQKCYRYIKIMIDKASQFK